MEVMSPPPIRRASFGGLKDEAAASLELGHGRLAPIRRNSKVQPQRSRRGSAEFWDQTGDLKLLPPDIEWSSAGMLVDSRRPSIDYDDFVVGDRSRRVSSSDFWGRPEPAVSGGEPGDFKYVPPEEWSSLRDGKSTKEIVERAPRITNLIDFNVCNSAPVSPVVSEDENEPERHGSQSTPGNLSLGRCGTFPQRAATSRGRRQREGARNTDQEQPSNSIALEALGTALESRWEKDMRRVAFLKWVLGVWSGSKQSRLERLLQENERLKEQLEDSESRRVFLEEILASKMDAMEKMQPQQVPGVPPEALRQRLEPLTLARNQEHSRSRSKSRSKSPMPPSSPADTDRRHSVSAYDMCLVSGEDGTIEVLEARLHRTEELLAASQISPLVRATRAPTHWAAVATPAHQEEEELALETTQSRGLLSWSLSGTLRQPILRLAMPLFWHSLLGVWTGAAVSRGEPLLVLLCAPFWGAGTRLLGLSSLFSRRRSICSNQAIATDSSTRASSRRDLPPSSISSYWEAENKLDNEAELGAQTTTFRPSQAPMLVRPGSSRYRVSHVEAKGTIKIP